MTQTSLQEAAPVPRAGEGGVGAAVTSKSWDGDLKELGCDFKEGMLASWCWHLQCLEEEPLGRSTRLEKYLPPCLHHPVMCFTLVAVSGFLLLPK